MTPHAEQVEKAEVIALTRQDDNAQDESWALEMLRECELMEKEELLKLLKPTVAEADSSLKTLAKLEGETEMLDDIIECEEARESGNNKACQSLSAIEKQILNQDAKRLEQHTLRKHKRPFSMLKKMKKLIGS